MKNRKSFLHWIAGIAFVWLLISGCGLINNTVSMGDTQTKNHDVALGEASEVKVQIDVAAGNLSVEGSAANLMEATFQYNVDKWEPEVSYTIAERLGELVVTHDYKGDDISIDRKLINEWTLLLSNAVPIDLEITTHAVDSELDLRGIDLTDLRIEVGAGTTNVDLSSAIDHDLHVSIRGGLGPLTVKLPSEMGVRVSAGTSISGLTNSDLEKDGKYYFNHAYGNAASNLYLDINPGVGAIHLLTP